MTPQHGLEQGGPGPGLADQEDEVFAGFVQIASPYGFLFPEVPEFGTQLGQEANAASGLDSVDGDRV
jgi:hypothetical protein